MSTPGKGTGQQGDESVSNELEKLMKDLEHINEETQEYVDSSRENLQGYLRKHNWANLNIAGLSEYHHDNYRKLEKIREDVERIERLSPGKATAELQTVNLSLALFPEALRPKQSAAASKKAQEDQKFRAEREVREPPPEPSFNFAAFVRPVFEFFDKIITAIGRAFGLFTKAGEKEKDDSQLNKQGTPITDKVDTKESKVDMEAKISQANQPSTAGPRIVERAQKAVDQQQIELEEKTKREKISSAQPSGHTFTPRHDQQHDQQQEEVAANKKLEGKLVELRSKWNEIRIEEPFQDPRAARIHEGIDKELQELESEQALINGGNLNAVPKREEREKRITALEENLDEYEIIFEKSADKTAADTLKKDKP